MLVLIESGIFCISNSNPELPCITGDLGSELPPIHPLTNITNNTEKMYFSFIIDNQVLRPEVLQVLYFEQSSQCIRILKQFLMFQHNLHLLLDLV